MRPYIVICKALYPTDGRPFESNRSQYFETVEEATAWMMAHLRRYESAEIIDVRGNDGKRVAYVEGAEYKLKGVR